MWAKYSYTELGYGDSASEKVPPEMEMEIESGPLNFVFLNKNK
jgi:hypothetical protein